MLNRRDAILGAGAAGALAAMTQPVRADTVTAIAPPDLAFLRTERLMNEDRARYFMRQRGLDAIAVAHPANVFYLTNHWPQLDRMGFTDSAIAIFPADPKKPLALVMGAFSYYYSHSPESAFEDRLVFPYTRPAGACEPGDESCSTKEPEPQPARTRIDRGLAPVSERNLRRREMLDKARPPSADPSWALAKALRELGLQSAAIGVDHPRLEELATLRGSDARFSDCEDLIRAVRMVKSPAEIRVMRLAAQQNVDAAMATAAMARELGSARALRARFVSEAGLRGNTAVFIVINGTSSEVVDEPLTDGMAFSIDCVSHCRHYHGDFARTIFIGEPHANMRRVTQAIAIAWSDIREKLRPGMKFADIPRIGKTSLQRQGIDLNVSFNPHSVGLFHTDHPQPSFFDGRSIDGLTLEENMIISVDCPPIDSGIGGTAHLEDLMLITRGGAESIHSIPPGVIVA